MITSYNVVEAKAFKEELRLLIAAANNAATISPENP